MRAPRAAPFAATLSFILPGLGQAAVGRRRRGLLVALPTLVLLGAGAGLAIAMAGDPTLALDLVPGPETILALLLLDAAFLLYRAWAILDAERLARLARPVRGWRSGAGGVVLAALLLGTVATHGTIAYVGVVAGDALGDIFPSEDPDDAWTIPETSFEPEPSSPSAPTPAPTQPPSPTPAPSPSAAPSTAPTDAASPAPSPTPPPTPEPTATPAPRPSPTPVPAWAKDGRLNLLLIGSDAGPDRWSLRTDTIILLSVDVDTRQAALFGIPRNMVNVPLPPESRDAFASGRYPYLLNSLYVYAMGHPKLFPGGDARGMRAVSGAIQELVGVRLDGMVVVNLGGFVTLVDELGGLWVDVPERLVDTKYPIEDGSKLIRVEFEPGCQHLDGRMALAYARSRHQDSDYGRMGRQQTVLLALRRQLDPMGLVPKVPSLLRIAGDSLWTTIKRSEIRGLAKLATRVDVRRVERVLFVPSRYPAHLDTAEIAAIRSRVRRVFDGAPPAPDPALAPGHCP